MCIQNPLTTLFCTDNWILTAGSFKHLAITISNIGFFQKLLFMNPFVLSLLVEITGF